MSLTLVYPHSSTDLPALAGAPIVQRIEQRTPKPWIQVQFLVGARATAGG